MDPTSVEHIAYSAAVRLSVHVEGEQLELAQVGPTWIAFDQPVALPAGPAMLEIEIDGQRDATPIELEACHQPTRQINYTLRSE